jgi:hypothetical protein
LNACMCQIMPGLNMAPATAQVVPLADQQITLGVCGVSCRLCWSSASSPAHSSSASQLIVPELL